MPDDLAQRHERCLIVRSRHPIVRQSLTYTATRLNQPSLPLSRLHGKRRRRLPPPIRAQSVSDGSPNATDVFGSSPSCLRAFVVMMKPRRHKGTKDCRGRCADRCDERPNPSRSGQSTVSARQPGVNRDSQRDWPMSAHRHGPHSGPDLACRTPPHSEACKCDTPSSQRSHRHAHPASRCEHGTRPRYT